MNELYLYLYALVFLRVVGFVFSMPIIGTSQIPVQIKVFLSVALTTIVSPLVNINQAVIPDNDIYLFLLCVYQVFIGIFIGFVARFFLFSMSIVGEWVGISSGSSSAQIYNPGQGSFGGVFDQFYVLMASLIFFTLSAHHVLLLSFVESFNRVNPFAFVTAKIDFLILIEHLRDIIVYGVKIALPIVIPILVTNIVMGVMARMVPQMNVFVTSLQVTFIITLVVLILSLPLLFDEIGIVLSDTLNRVNKIVEMM